MNSQQRPFFQAAISDNCSGSGYDVAVPSVHFRPCRWIAVICALLFFTSCASLTPERINVLAQIAGQAAQLGAQEWLAKHPEHRAAFDAVIVAISALVRNGNANILAYTELLSSLPTDTLKGVDGELYLSDTLVVYDNELGRSTRIKGAAEKPVMDAVRHGLRRAVGPTPPVPPTLPKWGFQNAKPEPPVLGIVPEGAPRLTNAFTLEAPPGAATNLAYPPGWTLPIYTNIIYVTNRPVHLSTSHPTNELFIEKTDAELDAEFEAIKARLGKPSKP